LVAVLGVSAQSPPGRALAIEDYYRVKTVGNPDLSPDGKWVAFTVSTRVEATNDNTSEVWLVASDGSAPARRVSADGANAVAPAWLDDGRLRFSAGGRAFALQPATPAEVTEDATAGRAASAAADGAGAWWTRRGRRRSRDAELRRNHERDRARPRRRRSETVYESSSRSATKSASWASNSTGWISARRGAVPARRIAPTRK
jgi:dipeptidyl aminopeptidase/acylaminoacyl peptidase